MTYLEQFIYSQELEPTEISALRSNRIVIEKYYLWRKELENWIPLKGCNYDDMIEELVEIKAENGEIFKAYPTFYNFKLINDKVVSCNSYWNGEFLHGEIKKSNITHYRKIK